METKGEEQLSAANQNSEEEEAQEGIHLQEGNRYRFD